MTALTFTRSPLTGHIIGQQPDGEPVGSITPHGRFFYVDMVDTRGNRVFITVRCQRETAQRALVRAWALQLSKGGNP